MFPTFEIVKQLCKKQGISLNTLEERIGFSRNSLYSWKNSSPKPEKLNTVANYFQVSTDYLLGRTDIPRIATNDTGASSVDLTNLRERVVMFDGKPLSDEDVKKIEAIIKLSLGVGNSEDK
ncbi:helix-turn-helix transcriptional regulator [Streptococcus parauberis]|uniref:helix-turn-helix domain-containing protein n=1 Tax=Streptococcus parauberis TaxID=1348 RepID=UPI00288EFEF7|nr:helix-turn-helix transcriptional regulator [Streptococcus parauberis]MDT2748844.1 helix-turn-helix transcriptional regulator [Streptococcus parauberis]